MDSQSEEPLINKWGSRKGLTFRPSTSDSQVQRKFKHWTKLTGGSNGICLICIDHLRVIIFFLALTLSMWPWTSHLTCRAIGSFIKLKGIPGHFLLGPSLWWKEMLHCWDFGRTHANTLIWSSEKNPSLYGKNYKTQRRKEFGYKPTYTLPFLKCYLKESVFWDRKQTGTKELTVSREARIECSSLPRLLFKVWYASVKSSLVPPPLPNEKTVTKYLSIQCLSMWFYLEKKSL